MVAVEPPLSPISYLVGPIVGADWFGRRIVGNTFEWADFVAYGLAAWAAVLMDRRLSRAGRDR